MIVNLVFQGAAPPHVCSCGEEVVLPAYYQRDSLCECETDLQMEVGPHYYIRTGMGRMWFHSDTHPGPDPTGHEWVGTTQTDTGRECGRKISLVEGRFVYDDTGKAV